MMPGTSEPVYGQSTGWQSERPRLQLSPLIVSWLATGIAFMVAAGTLHGISIEGFWGALLVAAIVAALNAVVPPVLAALRLPLTLVLGFLLVQSPRSGIAAGGSTSPTPVANAKAAAEWPEGNEVEDGIRT